jgi:hypothetical protein
MESYREQFNLSLPPKGTKVYIEYMVGINFSIIWPGCPDGENMLYGWISSKAKALSIIIDHKWIDTTDIISSVEKQKKRIALLKSKKKDIMEDYKLIITETSNKAGKYLYQVVDQDGHIIKERRSNREYVACTVFDNFYFGRLDLIGKGDHGRMMKMWSTPAYHKNYSNEEAEKRLNKLNTIAYK